MQNARIHAAAPARPCRRARRAPRWATGVCVAWSAAALGQGLPQGARVTQGQASFATTGTQLTIHNSANAVLEWRSFSIGAGQAVRFEQPGPSSHVLNRVVGSSPSEILGQLSSNGRVWLLNPNGILFGPAARVDVAALVASTLRINDADWQARRHVLFGGGAGVAAVTNLGTLRTTTGGHVVLAAAEGGVRNQGVIEAPGGRIVLGAARSIELADSAMPHIAYRVSAPVGEVVNLGTLRAADGRIDLQAALVAQRGTARADASSPGGRGGQVALAGTQEVTLSAGSVTAADGATGGLVVADSGRAAGATTWVDGTVSVQGTTGAGGTVRLLGERIGLLDGARVDASGQAGGGTVHVGGAPRGADPQLPPARAVYMAPGATLAADARASGPGGLVALWADEATRAYGSLSARGGDTGGHGGLIETSGGWLDARPRHVDASAPRGRAGTWLLDPNNITITPLASLGSSNVSGGPDFVATGPSALLDPALILSALNDGLNVTVSNGPDPVGTAPQAGNITIQNANFTFAGATPVSLTFNATAALNVAGSIFQFTGAAHALVFNAGMGAPGTLTLAQTDVSVPAGTVAFRVAQSTAGNLAGVPLGFGSDNTNVSAAAVSVRADGVRFGPGTSIQGLQAGTAVTVAGATGNLVALADQTAGGALATANGRWLVWAADPSDPRVQLGPLDAALQFTQHRAVIDDPAVVVAAPGNGLLSAQAPTIAVSAPGLAPTKTYDGTAVAPVPAGVLGVAGLRPGDALAPTAVLGAAYATPGVGTAIPLIASLDAGASAAPVVDGAGRPVFGYGLNPVVPGAVGRIDPAVLTVTADTAVMVAGTALPPLGGSVAGFVAGENQASATTGALRFASPAGPTAGPGVYPVTGDGLSAPNYVVTQAASNATALRVVDPLPPGEDRVPWKVRIAPLPPHFTPGLVSDMPTVLPPSLPVAGLFGPQDWSSMSPFAMAGVLEARDHYSAFNHHYAMQRLQLNPHLADVPYCREVEGALAGTCRLTAALVPAFRARCPLDSACMAPRKQSAATVGDSSVRRSSPLRVPVVAWADGGPMAAPPARPAPTPGTGAPPTRWVLAIGIGEYRDPLMHGIAGRERAPSFSSRRDADLTRQALVERLDYRPIPLDGTAKTQIIEAFNKLIAWAEPGHSVVVYYAGYGASDPTRSHCYWSTSTSRHDDPAQWISNRNAGQMLGDVRASQVILLVDSCFSDPVSDSDRADIAAGARDPGADGLRAATVLVSGTNAPLADERGDRTSAFARGIITQTGALTGPRAGYALYLGVRSDIARLLSRITEAWANRHMVGYRGSLRAGHRPGSDFYFRPLQPGRE